MKELYSALASAQGEFKAVPKNKEVLKQGVTKAGKPFQYSYRYADLDSIIAHIRPVLAKHGLSFSQLITTNQQCVTYIRHASGDEIATLCPCVYSGDDMQKIGAAISYSKRYCLSLAFGISTDDDLDGNELQNEPYEVKPAISTRPQPKEQANMAPSTTAAEVYFPPAQHAPNKYPLSEKQVKRLYAIANSNKWTPKYADAYLKATFNKSAADLTRPQYEQACDFLSATVCDDMVRSQYEPSAKPAGSVMEQFEEAKKNKAYVDHTAPYPPDIPMPNFPDDEIPF